MGRNLLHWRPILIIPSGTTAAQVVKIIHHKPVLNYFLNSFKLFLCASKRAFHLGKLEF